MGWGIYLAQLTFEGAKTVAEINRHKKAEQAAFENLLQKQEENRLARLLKVENSIIADVQSLYELTGEKRLLLEGESMSFERQLALPGVVRHNYFNTVISGGDEMNRAFALLKTIEDAHSNGLPTIVIHCGNHMIESLVGNSTSIKNKFIINSQNGLYDPFLSMSPPDIAALFMKSADDNAKQHWNFQALVGLIAELYAIRQKKSLALKALLNTTVADLPKKIQESRANGLIDDAKMIELNQRYQSAQNDVYSFQQYLNQLRGRFENFYSQNKKGGFIGIGQALKGNTIITLDITDSSNEELVRLIVNKLYDYRRKGVDFVACFSDLNLSDYGEVMFDYARSNGGKNKFSVCSPDVVSSLGSDKLDMLMGLVRNRVYFNHADGNNCAVLSDGLGSYPRWEITYTYSNANRGLIPDVTCGTNLSRNPTERRIPTEVLMSLTDNQMVFKDGSSNDIYLMCLT